MFRKTASDIEYRLPNAHSYDMNLQPIFQISSFSSPINPQLETKHLSCIISYRSWPSMSFLPPNKFASLPSVYCLTAS